MSEISELEKLYLPSWWSKRYSSEEILQKFEEITTKLSNEVKEEIPCELGIPYGEEDNEKIDIFGITLPNDAPIFIFIHGGYWQEETIQRHTSSYMARSLYKKGCKTIIVGYTLCPDKTISEIIDEIQQAVKKCLKYALENKARSVSIGGHSAGAHLSMNLFPTFFNTLTNEEKNIIKSIFLIGGIYNLVPLLKTTINDLLELTEDTVEDLSPMFKNFESVTSNSVKFFVIVGENDSPVFVKQSELFYDKLKKQGLQCDFLLLENLDHFDIVEKMDCEDYEIIQLIAKSLN